MRCLLKSTFGQTDEAYKGYLEQLLVTEDLYNDKYKVSFLTTKEKEFCVFLISCYKNAKQMPSEDLFVNNFPETTDAFNGVRVLSIDDYRVYLFNFINKRLNKEISKEIMNTTQTIEKEGITEGLMQRLNTLHKLSSMNNVKDVEINFDLKKAYEEKKNRPVGMIFNIPIIDEKIGGLSVGSMSTIAAFTSHFKSTMATNLAYYNAYHLGYNIVIISLETPKEDVWYNILSRHSYDMRFAKYSFIPHEKIKMLQLSAEEEAYLFDVIEKDFMENAKGKIIILDETDFETLSFTEIYNVFEQIDEKLGGYLDAFIIDYIQLFKFSESRNMNDDDNKAVNAYISFFRRLTQSFRDGKHKKQLIGTILSQINRTAWKKADKNGGRYDLTALADANELERGSHRVFTIFTSDEMKMNKEASVQILKNRNGRVMWEPEVIFVEPEAYVFGEDVGSQFASPSQALGGANLGDLFGDDSLGGLI